MFEGKTALVTGASSGIGRDVAVQLAKKGATVHGLGRDATRLAALESDGITPHAVDLTDLTQVEALGALPALDILIHSAGVCTLGPIAEAPIEDLETNFALNLRAPVLLTQVMLPKLVASKGHVVFVNSGAGLNANPNWGHYAASKFGIKAIADSLRHEVKPKGVRVLSIYPGRTATPMQQAVRQMEGAPYEPEKYLDPADVASSIVHALGLPRTADVIDLNIRTGPG